MCPENVHKANRLGELSRSSYEGQDEDKSAESVKVSSEEAVLIVADENVSLAAYRGILAPELRARLDAMTRDYARILTRIDRMADRDTGDAENAAENRRKTSN